jgi:hypothetical protein
LSCFCTEDFEINSPQPNLEIHTKISSTWTTYTAGGPIGCNSFDTNPQYYIFIPYSNINRTQPAEIQLSVSSSATTAVNALLFPVEKGGGTDLIFATGSHPVIDTGNYRHGFVVSNRTTIPSGAYKLVVSNYHVGQVGFFTLTVSSNIKNITIEKINCR